MLTKAMVMEHFDELVTDRAIRLENVRAHTANDREGNRFLNRYWVPPPQAAPAIHVSSCSTATRTALTCR